MESDPTLQPPPKPAKRVNLRTPDVMATVQAQVEGHYRSAVVEKLRARGGLLSCDGLTIKLAKQFGFCYGVERAIDLAYAARKVFQENRVFILGEIIHNPEVNEQIRAMGIKNLVGETKEADVDDLTAEDVVIVPAFGTEVNTLDADQGARLPDCRYDLRRRDERLEARAAKRGRRHDLDHPRQGRARGDEGDGFARDQGRARALPRGPHARRHRHVCDYIRHGGDRAAFLKRFAGAHSEGFDPDVHLRRVGVANQTTMLRGETEEVQRRIEAAIRDRDGAAKAPANFRFFDTICGATQERQDALRVMLNEPMDLLLVVGGYNSSNTSHLAEMGEEKLPTYFIRNASRLESRERIVHYNLHAKTESPTENWLPHRPLTIGITAGASCPNNLIEETILRLFELHGIEGAKVLDA